MYLWEHVLWEARPVGIWVAGESGNLLGFWRSARKAHDIGWELGFSGQVWLKHLPRRGGPKHLGRGGERRAGSDDSTRTQLRRARGCATALGFQPQRRGQVHPAMGAFRPGESHPGTPPF